MTTLLASMFLAVTVAAPTASAAPVPLATAPGSPDHLHLWSAQWFQGTQYGWHWSEFNGCFNLPAPFSNQTTSIVNKSSAVFDVFDGPNCTRHMATIWAYTANDNIGPANNDRITSLRRR